MVTKAAFHASPQLYAEPVQAIFKQITDRLHSLKLTVRPWK